MPITNEELDNLRPRFDCSIAGDLRGQYVYRKVVVNIGNADLIGAVFYGCHFSSQHIPNYEAIINVNEVRKLEDIPIVVDSYDFKYENFVGHSLRGAVITNCDLTRANLSGVDLEKANLKATAFTEADLTDVNLRGANLASSYFSSAILRGADLRGGDLTSAFFTSSDLRGADLRGADLRWGDFSFADFREANLKGAIYNNKTSLYSSKLTWGQRESMVKQG